MEQGLEYPLKDFMARYRSLSEEEFLHRFPLPFLVIPGEKHKIAPKLGEEKKNASLKDNLKTMEFSLSDLANALPTTFQKVDMENAVVFPLAQKEENRGKKILKIGRDPSNDLFLDDPEVSTYHASLIWKENLPMVEPCFYIMDHGSTNGTYVDSLGIQPHKEILLKDQCTVEIGMNFFFIFYHPDTFYFCVSRAKIDL
ncbi:MAG: FHA domain-containing protein [Planctomycetota bacterium]|nr:MAG: FHA domain-containing protein [Planctomycetota bacterium]